MIQEGTLSEEKAREMINILITKGDYTKSSLIVADKFLETVVTLSKTIHNENNFSIS